MRHDTSRMHMIRRGRNKDVYEVDPMSGNVLFEFNDRASVFGNLVPSAIPRKGEATQKTAVYWFKLLDKLGIENHFIGSTPPDQMMVRRFRAFPTDDKDEPLYAWAGPKRKGYQLPFKILTRHHVAGLLWERLQERKVHPEALGYPQGHDVQKLKKGERLPRPLVEFKTNLERFDRYITADEACRMGGISGDELKEIVDLSLRIDEEMEKHAWPRGLFHFDGKKEFALNDFRRPVVIDTFGTGDGDTFANRWSYENRNILVEYGVTILKQYYRSIGYYDRLQKIRSENRYRRNNGVKPIEEPAPPSLPPDMASSLSAGYLELASKITGEPA